MFASHIIDYLLSSCTHLLYWGVGEFHKLKSRELSIGSSSTDVIFHVPKGRKGWIDLILDAVMPPYDKR